MIGSWKLWSLILIIIFIIIWFFFGGKKDYEFVGLKPIIDPTAPLNNFVLIPKKNKKSDNFVFNKNRKFCSEGEEVTCQIFEEYLKREVKTNIRPNFLKNPETGRNLELDMFDEKSNIAIEYNGIQHYKYPNSMHSSEKVFYNQVYRDSIKSELAEKNGIILIIIPYTIDEEAYKEGNKKYKKLSKEERKIKIKEDRKLKIKNVLIPKLDSIFNGEYFTENQD